MMMEEEIEQQQHLLKEEEQVSSKVAVLSDDLTKKRQMLEEKRRKLLELEQSYMEEFGDENEDVKDDLFLNHDLNLYNFIINLNREMDAKGIQITGKKEVDLSMISTNGFEMMDFPRKWSNILDLRSAIEIFTPFYQLFLTRNDFYRASNSLQLDETIGIYSSKILVWIYLKMHVTICSLSRSIDNRCTRRFGRVTYLLLKI